MKFLNEQAKKKRAQQADGGSRDRKTTMRHVNSAIAQHDNFVILSPSFSVLDY